MASALQQQLAVIAANSTHQLDLKAQKAQHSKSLLFERRDAASQSFDTLYQLCLEGFEELCHVDVRFAPFGRSLFSAQSKSEDRTQMTAAENASLDTAIERFLGLLGGRLLLKPAMKAAEWLVRRFRVHEYNTEAVLLTFLQYHGSHIFTTLLSILPPQLPPNFRFLHPYVASLQCPPRHAIVVATSNSSALFTAFSQYVLNVAKARHHSTALLCFWASITAQAVNGMIDASRSGRETIRRQKEEDLLLKVVPILHNALAIKGVPELYLGSCMILTILATKSSLSDRAIDVMMEAVAAAWTEPTVNDGMVCLAILAEEKDDHHLPRSVTRAITKQAEPLATITHLGSKYRVDRLLTGLAVGVLPKITASQDQAYALVSGTLQTGGLSDDSKVEVLKAVITCADQLSNSEQDNSIRNNMIGILNIPVNQGHTGLLRTAARAADVSNSTLNAHVELQIQSGDGEIDEPEPMEVDDGPGDVESPVVMALEDQLPLSNGQISFLEPGNDDLFDAYCKAYLQALTSPENLSKLLNLPSLEQSECTTRPSTLSFLARIWSTDLSNGARVKALNITSDLLRTTDTKGALVDFQALLPYIITALGDSSKAIRFAASCTCQAIGDAGESDNAKKRSSSGGLLWGIDTIYGKESSKIQWLSKVDGQKLLLETIVPILDDCVIDKNYILQSLADALNATSAPGNPDRKELKSALRTSIYAFLASHVAVAPVLTVKLRLLSILRNVGKAAGPARGHILLEYVRRQITGHDGQSSLVLSKALIENVTHRSVDEIKFLKDLAAGTAAGLPNSKLGFDRLRQIWPVMKEPMQADVVDHLLNLALMANTPEEVQTEAVETLRNLSFSSSLIVHLVESLPSASELQDHPIPAKKQRISRTSELYKPGSVDKSKLTNAIRRITTVLELVEASKPERHAQLLKGLFHLLSELHHYKILLDSELVYLQGLLINSLLSVVEGLNAASNKDIDRSVVRTDLIVDCVRTTSSTQVHQSALLLVSALASWAPELVLHSVMPLFTFMSSTILKQGDDYSAHVTDQTVARIIPPLAVSLKKRGKDLISGAAELLLSFTAAFEHIPLHRRIGLFQHLIQTLGASESLFAITAMLIERYPEDTSVRPFVSSLIGRFPIFIQLSAVQQYLDLVTDTIKPKRTLSDAILGFSEKSSEQAIEATGTLLDGLADLLAQEVLRRRLAKELKIDDDKAESLRVIYSVVLEKTMQLGLELKDAERLHNSAGSVLKSLLGLMPTKDFIDSSAKLMQTGSDEIRQQVFWSLEQRVNTAERGDTALQQVFVEVLPNCAVFVSETQSPATRLAAIACIDRIAEKFGKTDRSAVIDAAGQISSNAALGSNNVSLRRMSLLCLSSMIEVLEDEFIPLFPKTLQTALGYMEAALNAEEREEDVLTACFSFATAILDHIPWMLAGTYLDRLLVIAADTEDENAKQFNELAARKVAASECLAALERTWGVVAELGAHAVQFHIETLREVVRHHSKAMIIKNAQALFSVLLNAFDLRRRFRDSDEEDADLTSLFELINGTTMDAILKLNDATFRPFFIRLSEWAFSRLPRQDEAGCLDRSISLYSFTLTLFEQLKSIVTGYAAYLLENVAAVLSAQYSSATADSLLLLTFVVQTLASSFAHDQDSFWQSPAHFDAVAEPLLSLLPQSSALARLTEPYVIPAIVELAAAANSPEHHQTIDRLLLSYMRHDDPAVRLASVKTQRALTERLTFDWCGLLPGWLPFINELQEDDDGLVERETLRWMEQIEGIVGESVNDMLK